MLESLREYFSQFGEVVEGTVMRDGATGRSRGFGFLTFRDPKTVNTVMVKEHFLDGKIVRASISDKSSAHPSNRKNAARSSRSRRSPKKGPFSAWTSDSIGEYIDTSLHYRMKIDPKRAIPRDEQEKTSKIFVGGVSQEASEQDFKEFFQQFGRVVDATLMMDKDTGRPRGFGFVTFDSEAAVEKCLDQQPLEILGKMIEVKKAQPRGKMGEEEDNRGGRGRGKFGRGGDDRYNDGGGGGGSHSQQGGQGNQPAQNTMAASGAGGMTPQMMAQYWQRMQQYFAMMQQQMAASAMQGSMGGMGMNPQMMAQMAQMQQMQQMQKQMQQNQQQGSMSPAPQSPGAQGIGNMGGGMQGMNPQMQQMMQMMQNQQQQQQGGMGGGGGFGMGGGPQGGMGGGGAAVAATAARPGFNAQEQMAFEQQKYEQQMARQQGFPHARQNHGPAAGNFNQQQPQQQAGGPTSWEGMYDDVPQPNAGGRASAGSGVVRNLTPMNGKPAPKGPNPAAAPPPNNAPANAPTGPKNAGRPGSNFRGGRGGGRFHPYGR